MVLMSVDGGGGVCRLLGSEGGGQDEGLAAHALPVSGPHGFCWGSGRGSVEKGKHFLAGVEVRTGTRSPGREDWKLTDPSPPLSFPPFPCGKTRKIGGALGTKSFHATFSL